jgi:hypothetical protein
MDALLAEMFRRARDGRGEEDGGATDREHTSLEIAQGGHDLATELALSVARVIALLQHLCPRLPSDVMCEIAEAALELPSQSARQMCACRGDAPPSLTIRPSAAHASQHQHVRCAVCGEVALATMAVRNPTPEGMVVIWVTLAGSEAVWKDCRHFHREQSASRAVRHRMSGLHSFRTIVCSDWILSGAAEYMLVAEQLQQPGSLSVGMVTPDADVNDNICWVAGTRDREHSWGICIEGLVEDVVDESEEYNEVRTFDARVHLPGFAVVTGDTASSGASSSSPSSLLLPQLEAGGLQQGQRFWIRIDADKRTLEIAFCSDEGKGPVLRLQLPALTSSHSHARAPTRTRMFPRPNSFARVRSRSRSYEEEEEEEEEESQDEVWERTTASDRDPLALAVGLKFACDTVWLTRIA